MTGRSMLLLAAMLVTSGCSRDAPTLAPESERPAAKLAVVPAAIMDNEPAAGNPIDDALQRLVPSLGMHGAKLRALLLPLQAGTTATTVSAALRALDTMSPTLSDEFQPDLAALRLHIAAATPTLITGTTRGTK